MLALKLSVTQMELKCTLIQDLPLICFYSESKCNWICPGWIIRLNIYRLVARWLQSRLILMNWQQNAIGFSVIHHLNGFDNNLQKISNFFYANKVQIQCTFSLKNFVLELHLLMVLFGTNLVSNISSKAPKVIPIKLIPKGNFFVAKKVQI